MRKDLALPILALAILVAILIASGMFTGAQRFMGKRAVTLALNENGKPWGPLPDGPQTYQVVSSEEAWPKFSETTINPLKVYPGDTQRMRVVIHDRVEVTGVTAEIETDNGINEVPLRLVEESALTQEDVLGQRYLVKDGKLIILGELERTKLALGGFLKRAEAADVRKFVFEGEWIVRDTHVKTYHTTFRAKNASGEENSITMAWSDPCSGIVDGANSALTGSCTIGAGVTDGIDGGSLSLGGHNLTLAGSGSTFVWNAGNALTINGSITINTGAQIRQTNLWVNDLDRDGWTVAGGGQLAQDAQPTGYVRRSSVGAGVLRTTGAIRPATAIAGSGPWVNPTNAVGSDDQYATINLPYTVGSNSYRCAGIVFRDFNLLDGIPANATINNVRIEVERNYSGSQVVGTGFGVPGSCFTGVFLDFGDMNGIYAADTWVPPFDYSSALGADWTTTDALDLYCNTTSTSCPSGPLFIDEISDITENPNFSVSVNVYVPSGSTLARIDDVRIVVEYTLPGYQGVGDCYEADPMTTKAELAFPGSPEWHWTDRGDGSFDYNCDGAQTKDVTSYTDNCPCFQGLDYCSGAGSCTTRPTGNVCGVDTYYEGSWCNTAGPGGGCANDLRYHYLMCS